MPKKTDGNDDSGKTYSEAEVKVLLAKASKPTSTNFEDITKRPYRTIKAADGTVVAYPPVGTPNEVAGHNGPWTIGDQHPDDWYGVDDDGVATKGV